MGEERRIPPCQKLLLAPVPVLLVFYAAIGSFMGWYVGKVTGQDVDYVGIEFEGGRVR